MDIASLIGFLGAVVLMILPMVPAPQRKQVMVMMFMYAMFGRGMYFL